MFHDSRSQKVIILSHCLLNQNSISDGTADFPSQFNEIIEILMKHRIGMIQLLCPELLCLGLDRRDRNGAKRPLLDENTRIRELMSENGQIIVLRNIETTSRNGEKLAGQGVFMEVFSETLSTNKLLLRMIGTKTSEKERSLEKIRQFINE